MSSKKKSERSHEDFNKIVLRNSRTKKVAQKIFFSRTVITFAAIFVQLLLLILFIVFVNNKLNFYFGISLAVSAAFIIYISNSGGKNEYKIAWLGITVLFPVIGITCYIIYHTDGAARKLAKEIEKINTEIDSVLVEKSKSEVESVEKSFPEYKNISNYLYKCGSFSPHKNSAVKYYANGETFYPDFLESLKSAKKYIFIEFFIITIDECWEKIVEILEQKVKEGVEVRLICDGVGTYMITGKAYQRYLKEKGIKSKVFNPLLPIISTPVNNRDHRKIVVIDGKLAYTGGINLSNQYFNYGKNKFPYWKDNFVEIRGPAIQNLLQLFFEVWNIGEKVKDDYVSYLNIDYEKIESDGFVIPYGDDAFNSEDIAESVYLEIINNAKKYLYITTPYVVIDNQMLTALTFAAKKGVDVRIIVPSKPDHLITFCIGKTYLKNLLDGGVKIYLYEKGFIHAKTFLCDDNVGTVGSINLDYRSLYAHFECGALICKNPALADIKADFESMFKNDCQKMNVQDYKKIPAWQRFTGRVLRLFGPLL